MQNPDWAQFLSEWNQLLITNCIEEGDLNALPQGDAVAGEVWLGSPGASEPTIQALEQHLGIRLPPSYRAFLKESNGFQQPRNLVPQLYALDQIEWYRTHNQETIDAWMDGVQTMKDMYPREEEFADDLCEAELEDDPFERYLPTALQISAEEEYGSAVYLLNPQKIDANGEWEAFYFASWIPGATRYSSFWELMCSEHNNLLTIIKQRRGEPTPYADPALGIAADDLDGLIAALAQPDTQRQSQAIVALGNLRDRRAFDPITAILSDPDADLFVREHAARSLGQLRDPRSALVLLQVYRMPYSGGSADVLRSTLSQLPGEMPPQDLDTFIQLANQALGLSMSGSAVRAGMADHFRAAIAQGLFALDRAALPLLRQALNDSDASIRALAADVIQHLERQAG